MKNIKGNKAFDKVYACLIGGIIGDAMGAPTEGKTYQQIEEEFGEVIDFEGSGTDDSIIRSILSQSLIENKGQITADEFGESFLKNEDKYNYFFIPVKNMYHKIQQKLSLPVDAGWGNMQSSSSAMSISPMGIVNACNPRQAALETYDVAGLIHAGISNFCRDGACAIAAAIAEALKPKATVDSVIHASTAYLHKTSAAEMIGCIRQAVALAKETGNYKDFRHKFYEKHLYSIISDSRETVPCTFALFYLAEGDPVKAIIYAANFGRDADTIGTMVGGLCGALKGVNAFKDEWVKKVDKNNPEQRELAKKLIEIAAMKYDAALISVNLFLDLFQIKKT
jgi:ADP-ribosylglycohydrolase